MAFKSTAMIDEFCLFDHYAGRTR